MLFILQNGYISDLKNLEKHTAWSLLAKLFAACHMSSVCFTPESLYWPCSGSERQIHNHKHFLEIRKALNRLLYKHKKHVYTQIYMFILYLLLLIKAAICTWPSVQISLRETTGKRASIVLMNPSFSMLTEMRLVSRLSTVTMFMILRESFSMAV